LARKSDIRLRRSNVANAVPGSADLNEGELAINTADGALYFKKSDGTIITGHDDTIMHIDSDDNRVGIGTASPNTPLHLQSSIDYVARFQSTDTTVGILLQDSNATNRITNTNGNLVLSADINGVVANSSIRFVLDNTSNTGADADMVLNSTGLGIGTSTPKSSLNVRGTAAAGGILTLENDSTSLVTDRKVGQIHFYSNDGSTNGAGVKADINAIAENSIGSEIGLTFGTSGTGSSTAVEAMRIDSSGKIGIGISTNIDSNLHVADGTAQINIEATSGDATLKLESTGNSYWNIFNDESDARKLKFEDNGNGVALTIARDGKVGIGTSSPSNQLHIQSSGTSSAIRLEREDTSDEMLILLGSSYGYVQNTTGPLGLGGTNSSTDIYINASGKVGIGTDSPQTLLHLSGANPEIRLSDTTNTNYNGIKNIDGNMIYMADSGNQIGNSRHRWEIDGSEKMRLHMNGYLGIGTTSPSSKLDVQQTTAGNIISAEFDNTDYTANNRNAIKIRQAVSSSGSYSAYLGSDKNTGNVFLSNDSITANHLVINTSGKVGIGTISPGKELDVVGTVRAQDSNSNQHQLRADKIIAYGTDAILQAQSAGDDVRLNTEGNVTRLIATAEGNVGIGTASPVTKLHVGPDSLKSGYTTDRTTLAVSDIDDGAELILRGQSPRIWFDATSSGNGQIYLDTVELQVYSGFPGSAGTQRLNINSSGAITFNNAFTFPTAIGAAGQILKVPATGTTLVWGADAGGGSATLLTDGDGDTLIQVEESSDEDIIRFDAAGIERFKIGSDVQVMGTTDFNITGANRRISFTSGTGTVKTTGASALKFGTNNTDRMTITATGNVGIGTASPAEKLHVVGGAATVKIESSTNEASLKYDNSTTTGVIKLANNDLKTELGGSEVMRILANGNVGIGTTSPVRKLHVDGAVRIDGGTGVATTGVLEVMQNGDDHDSGISLTSSHANSHRIYKNSSGVLNIGSSASATALQQAVNGDITLNAQIFKITGANPYIWGTGSGSMRIKHTSGQTMYIRPDESGTASFFEGSTGGSVYLMTQSPTVNNTTNDSTSLFFQSRSRTAGGVSQSATARIRARTLNIATNESELLVNGVSQIRLAGNTVVDGNLTVNGTQTILNTATLSVDDLNITVADGAADAAAANGAGLTVDGANATWNYSSGDDAWASNKHAQFYTGGGTGTLSVGRTSNQAIRLYADDNYNRIFAYQDSDTNGDHFFDLVRSFQGTGKADMRFMSGTAVHAVLNKDGNFGIGETNPTHKLHVAGDIRIDNGSALKLYNAAGNGWAQIAYNNTLDHIEIQRSFQSATDSYYNLGSSGKKWLSVYSDTIKASNGTPAAPTYTFDSDQNTGMYIDSTGDTLRFSTGGVQRMYLNNAGITSAANIYSGTTSEFRNYGGTWKATTGTAAGDFEFRGNTGGTNTGLMYMDTSTGRVAVGNGFNSTNVKSEFQVYHAGIDTYAVNTSATSAAQVDTFPAADFRSARFTVQITNTTDSTYQITEILLIHDGTTPSMTEYGTIFTGSAAEATFDADIVSGNIRLLATPASADSMQFKVVRHSILV